VHRPTWWMATMWLGGVMKILVIMVMALASATMVLARVGTIMYDQMTIMSHKPADIVHHPMWHMAIIVC